MRKSVFLTATLMAGLLMLSTGSLAYQIFNHNPSFINSNGYYIADSFTNSSCFLWWCTNNTYSCFDNQNATGKLLLSNSSRCDFNGNFNSASVTIKMLSNGGYYKMSNGDYQYLVSRPNSEWCDQPEKSPFGIQPVGVNLTPPVCSGWDYMVLPKNKEGIVVLDYSLTDNTYLDPSYTVLEVWENGDTQLNSTIITSGATTKTLFIPASNHDRNITVFASWKWYTPIPIKIPVTNITINKFEFYTMDTTEIRTDWTNNNTFEMQKYCGDDFTLVPTFVEFHDSFVNTSTAYGFGYDDNGLMCGYVKLGTLILARQYNWQFLNPAVCSFNYFEMTPNLFFAYLLDSADSNRLFVGFFESLTRTQAKLTVLFSNYTGDTKNSFKFDDLNSTTVYGLENNYQNAFRETITLINNPLVNITNNNPAGNNFQWGFYGGYVGCVFGNNGLSRLYPFFSSSVTVDNTGWYCSAISNQEGFILSNGTEINTKYCGDFGCNPSYTRCNFGFTGTYCSDDHNWIYRDAIGVQNSGTCAGFCVNKTYGVNCYSNDNTTLDCIDNTGNFVSCSSLLQRKSADIAAQLNQAGNWYAAASFYIINGVTGTTDIDLAVAASSFLFIMIGSFIVLIIARRSKHLDKIIGIFFIGGLMLLTLISAPYVAYLLGIDVVLFVLAAALLSGQLQKLIGGGENR